MSLNDSKYNEKLNNSQRPINGCQSRMTENNNNGISFSTIMAYDTSNDYIQKKQIAISILRKISVFGTINMRIDIDSIKLSNDVVVFLNKLVTDGYGELIINEFYEVYSGSLSPKMTTVIYLLAYMTSLSQSVAGSNKIMTYIRSKAYEKVSILRTGSHILDWISQHRKLSKSSGKGFRNAITRWFFSFNDKPIQLALQVTKYYNRNTYTFQDICRLVHPKTTTAKRCSCRGKTSCLCPKPNPETFIDLCSLGVQVVIGYLAQDIDNALNVLIQGISRSRFQSKGLTDNIYKAIQTFAFLTAVLDTKNADIAIKQKVELIRAFSLPWEVIYNGHVHNVLIQEALTFDLSSNSDTNNYNYIINSQITKYVTESKIDEKQRITLLNDVIQLFPVGNLTEKYIEIPTRVIKPITALIRQLNQMDNLIKQHPRGQTYLQLICNHLKNKKVIIRGKVHPLNILNAWATYKTGKGMRGNLRWTVNQYIVSSLMDAVEKAFYTVEGLGVSIAHLMDRSGSMTWINSVSGMPMLTAQQVVSVMVLCFMRAEKRMANETKTYIPLQTIGYFGAKTTSVQISTTEAGIKAKTFHDMTNKITPDMNFNTVENVLNSYCNWGNTDIGAGIYYLIAKLEFVITELENKNEIYTCMSPFELFQEVIIIWTDNDVNSGDQPMIVLGKYRQQVRRLFELLPYDKNGVRQEPNIVAKRYIPKMIVVATSGTHTTIGDPYDQSVLTVSGFDLSFPTIIKTFISQ